LVQVFPLGQSLVCTHWTHWPPWQVGAVVGQLVFERHATQLPSGAQNVFGAVLQSALARHCTHDDDET
jgi:hypothetical protein